MARIRTLDMPRIPRKGRPEIHPIPGTFGFMPDLFQSIALSPTVTEASLGLSQLLQPGRYAYGLMDRIDLAFAGVRQCKCIA